MEIEVKFRYDNTYISIKDTNVSIEEDVSENIYALNGDGQRNLSKRLGTDITTESLVQFSTILDNLMYHRHAPFDSSELIFNLMEHLPREKADEVCQQLFHQYHEEEEV